MARLRPGWFVVLCATVLLVSAWLPWLVTSGGRASAIGGKFGQIGDPPPDFGVGQVIVLLGATLVVAAAMAARTLYPRLSSAAALSISVLILVLVAWYYRLYVGGAISAGYGFYIGAAAVVVAVVSSVLTMVAAWPQGRRRR